VNCRLDYRFKEYGVGYGKNAIYISLAGNHVAHYRLNIPIMGTATMSGDTVYEQIVKILKNNPDKYVVINDNFDYTNDKDVVFLIQRLHSAGYKVIFRTSMLKAIPDSIALYLDYVEIMPKLYDYYSAYSNLSSMIGNLKNRIFVFFITSTMDAEQVYNFILDNHLQNEEIWLVPDGDTKSEMWMKKDLVWQVADRFHNSGFRKVVYAGRRSDITT